MSITEISRAGGIVMVPLLLFSIVAIALSVERVIFGSRISRQQRPLVKGILQSYRCDPSAAINTLKGNLRLPIARIFLEGLELDGASPSQFRLALEGATQLEILYEWHHQATSSVQSVGDSSTEQTYARVG